MKKLIFPLLALMLILAACGNNSSDDASKKDKKEKTYTQDSGKKVKIPKDPKRIVVLGATYAGGLKELDANIVGVANIVDDSKVLKDKFKDVDKVDAENVESVAKLKPDLIITYNTDKNLKKLNKVAPTIAFDYMKHDYKEQHKELGKIVGKEDKAEDWIKDWEEKTKDDGNEIKDAIGEDTTVSIIKDFDKKIYALGKTYGHGSEILYDSFGLKMPEKVEKATKKNDLADISEEQIPEMSGDYVVTPVAKGADLSFENKDIWKNTEAVKNGKTFKVDEGIYWLNDPYSLDYERKDLKEKLLNH
ncbi:ferrichrome ABC transporter substrate-binding protein [Staphylococcus saprophyticus]|uniref:Putative ferrichrome-binding lipoprotein n=1 Tax=Staphylococcus saprophyticus subsp. saprophyticus (strain ATCC 15305 / DSM 20229 / NCIMB 8711 / NCTC 7292 / S-41) TaxID=342451 RepID=Q4A0I6_STAS1|nr:MULTISPECIES: ABC transporter substrate-binding protein [Staphylococcus]CRV26549.1 periplasmic binding family protein [Streptococcus equi subsp. equi]AMG19381.1 ferrichrome ABC transporter substrate-binding protein [Staphylococcus saprophyticus]AMG32493.1 ferrichrome ABC transporter substrate-binding protein [Staphylococcus saprophyticus]ASF19402.1 ferrichrome ABC transporter substrate-binding protein [Staphylococcus saprophyticus]MBM0844948.1 ferrichrome ABC transporter substrate-binding p